MKYNKMDLSCLIDFEKELVDKLSRHQFLKHNHLPMMGLQPSCSYCKIFGNVFENGILSKQTIKEQHAVFKTLKN
jgi:hypothetical protein